MGFSSIHPIMSMMYFLVLFFLGLRILHPLFSGFFMLGGALYLLYLERKKGLLFLFLSLLLLLGMVLYTLSVRHFGVTLLFKNHLGNNITLESLIFGVTRGLRLSGAFLWLMISLKILTKEKITYLVGRLFPRVSLILSISFRFIPRAAQFLAKSYEARKTLIRPKGLIKGVSFYGSLIGQLISWILEELFIMAQSMKTRGYGLKGRRNYSLYRFDYRDRLLCILFTLLGSILLVGTLLDQYYALYDPRIILVPINLITPFLYGSFLVMMLLPVLMEVGGSLYYDYRVKAFYTRKNE